MRCSLSLSPVQRCAIRLALQVPNSVTLTVFPMSENWLRESSDHQMAVTRVPSRSKAENFRSLMDYLFANVFVGTYWMVMDFYSDEAPPLREIITQAQCGMIDELLVEALKLAYADFCEDRVRSWSRVRNVSDKIYYRAVG